MPVPASLVIKGTTGALTGAELEDKLKQLNVSPSVLPAPDKEGKTVITSELKDKAIAEVIKNVQNLSAQLPKPQQKEETIIQPRPNAEPPAPAKKDNTTLYIIIGAALLFVVIVVMVLKK